MGSLGNELKDFISAFQAGKKMFSTTDEEYAQLRNKVLKQKLEDAADPETKALNKQLLKRRANAPYYRPKDPLDQAYKQKRLDLLQKQIDIYGNQGNGAADSIPDPSPAPSQRQSALDLGDQDVAQLEDDEEDDVPVTFAAKGGLIEKPVRKYALGGAVEDVDDDEDDVTSEVTDDDDDGEIASTGDGLDLGFSREAGHEAVLEGLKYAQAASRSQSDAPRGAIPTTRAPSGAGYLRGQGAASANEMAAVYKKIDPDQKMSESERNLAALAKVYEFKLRQNDPDGARRAAGSMVQYMRMVSDRYKSLANVAAQNGDVDGTLRAIAKAHANVPDGVDLKFKRDEKSGKISYEFMDTQSGKTTERGVASPEELLQWATRGGIPDFDSLVVAAGGQRAAGKAAPKAPTGKTRDDFRGKVDERLDSDLAAEKRKANDPEIDGSQRHVASQILAMNDLDPGDAIDFADRITNEPGTEKVKLGKGKDGAPTVTVDGRTLKISEDAFDNIVALRGKAAALRAATDKKNTAEKATATKKQTIKDELQAKNKSRLERNRSQLDRMKNYDPVPAQRGEALPTGLAPRSTMEPALSPDPEE